MLLNLRLYGNDKNYFCMPSINNTSYTMCKHEKDMEISYNLPTYKL
jgi:hypothetical protein